MPNPKCRYCDRPAKRKDAVVCISPVCNEMRLKENRDRYNAKRKDTRKKYGRKPERREDYCKAITKKVEMVCECGRKFRTFLTWDQKPQYRYCLECREVWRDLDAGAMF